MERTKDIIGIGWVNQSEESKTKLLTQVKIMIQKTQELRPLEDIEISSVSRWPLFDCHLPDDSLHLGPFSSVQSFHQPFTSWHGIWPETWLKFRTTQSWLAYRIHSWRSQQLDSSWLRWWYYWRHWLGNSRLVPVIQGIYNSLPSQRPELCIDQKVDKFFTSLPDELRMEKTCQKYSGHS